MDFTVLKYFQAVARSGNMTKTARELYITQPNLSKRIAQLEEEIGVPLFDHRKGKSCSMIMAACFFPAWTLLLQS